MIRYDSAAALRVGEWLQCGYSVNSSFFADPPIDMKTVVGFWGKSPQKSPNVYVHHGYDLASFERDFQLPVWRRHGRGHPGLTENVRLEGFRKIPFQGVCQCFLGRTLVHC
jgi:hypothetical protein